jgi:hypothetical protein
MAQKQSARRHPAAARQPNPATTDILVKAMRLGYYNHERRRVGDTFYLLQEEDFSDRWMAAVDDNREEIPEETERLAEIAKAAKRVARAEQLERQAQEPNADSVKAMSAEDARAKLEAAKKKPAARREQPKRKAPAVDVGANFDPKRKIAGSDYEKHEDFKPTDNQGAEPLTNANQNRKVI